MGELMGELMGASWCYNTSRDLLDVSTDAQDSYQHRHGSAKLAPFSRLALPTVLSSVLDQTVHSHPGFAG